MPVQWNTITHTYVQQPQRYFFPMTVANSANLVRIYITILKYGSEFVNEGIEGLLTLMYVRHIRLTFTESFLI